MFSKLTVSTRYLAYQITHRTFWENRLSSISLVESRIELDDYNFMFDGTKETFSYNRILLYLMPMVCAY